MDNDTLIVMIVAIVAVVGIVALLISATPKASYSTPALAFTQASTSAGAAYATTQNGCADSQRAAGITSCYNQYQVCLNGVNQWTVCSSNSTNGTGQDFCLKMTNQCSTTLSTCLSGVCTPSTTQ